MDYSDADVIKLILQRCLDSQQVHTATEAEALELTLEEINIIVEELIDTNKVELMDSFNDGYLIKMNSFTKSYLEKLSLPNPPASNTTIIVNDNSVNKDKSNGKQVIYNPPTQESKLSSTHKVVTILTGLILVGIAIAGLIMSQCGNKVDDESIPLDKSVGIKSPLYSVDDDRFNILILSFYTADDTDEANCVGNSIYTYFKNEKLLNDTSLILYSYNPEFGTPNNFKEAEAIRGKENADFLIYGIYSKIDNTCSNLNTCFRYISNEETSSTLAESGLLDQRGIDFSSTSDVEIMQGQFNSKITVATKWMVALANFKKKNHEISISLLESIINQDEYINKEIGLKLCISYLNTKKAKKALKVIEVYFPNSDDIDILSKKANALSKVGRSQEALKLYETIIDENNPIKFQGELLGRSIILQNLKRHDEAQKDLEKLGSIDPIYLYLSGAYYIENGQYQKALDKLELAYSRSQKYRYMMYLKIMVSSMRTKDYNKAYTYGKEALKNDQDHEQIYVNLSLACLYLLKSNEGIHFTGLGLEKHPDSLILCNIQNAFLTLI